MSFVVLWVRHGSAKFAALTNYGGRIVYANSKNVFWVNKFDKHVISKEQTRNKKFLPYKRTASTIENLLMSVMCKPVKRKTSFCAFYISGIITTLVLLQIILTLNNSCALNAEWAVRSQIFNLSTSSKYAIGAQPLEYETPQFSLPSSAKHEFLRKEQAKEVKEKVHTYVTDDKWRQFVHHHKFVENSPFADLHIPSLALPALHKYTEETELCTSYVSPLRRWECLPAIAFLLHCITRLLECCFVHKFRCGPECVDDKRDSVKGKKYTDSVTLFATLAGCSFYIFASLSTSFILLPLIREGEVMSSMRNQIYYTPQNKFRLLPEIDVITNTNTNTTTATTNNNNLVHFTHAVNVTATIHDNTIIANEENKNYINNRNNVKNLKNNNNLFTSTIDELHYTSADKIAYFSSWLDAAKSPSTRDVECINTNVTRYNISSGNSEQHTSQVKFTPDHSENINEENNYKEINDIIALRQPWYTLRSLLVLLPEWFTTIIIIAFFVLHISWQILQVMHHSVLASLRSSHGYEQEQEDDRVVNMRVLKWTQRKLEQHTRTAIAVRAHEDQNDARWMRRRRTALSSSSFCNEKEITTSNLPSTNLVNNNNNELNSADCKKKVDSYNRNNDDNLCRQEQVSNISSSPSSLYTGVDKRIFSYHFPSTRLLFQYVLEPHYTLEVLMYCTNTCMMCIFIFYGICFAPAAIEQTKFDSLLPNVFVTPVAESIFREYAMSWKYVIAFTLQLFPAFAVALFSFCNLAITAQAHRDFWLYVNEERDVSRTLLSTDL